MTSWASNRFVVEERTGRLNPLRLHDCAGTEDALWKPERSSTREARPDLRGARLGVGLGTHVKALSGCSTAHHSWRGSLGRRVAHRGSLAVLAAGQPRQQSFRSSVSIDGSPRLLRITF